MSNIRSASSKTKNVTRCKFVALIFTKSIIRPGNMLTNQLPQSLIKKEIYIGDY